MTESEQLLVQISAYLDNMFDVAQLVEDSEQKSMALERVAQLEMELSRANERIQEIEAEYMTRIVYLDNRLADLVKERDSLIVLHQKTDNEMTTLKRTLTQKEQESKQQQSRLESRIQELEDLQKNLKGINFCYAFH